MPLLRPFIAAALLHAGSLSAASLDIDAINTGFLTAEGGASNFDGLLVEMATFNYSVGWELHYDGGGLKPTVPLIYQEKRNYFVFDLSSVTDPITSAVLELGFPAGGYSSPDASEEFILSATPVTAPELEMLKTAPVMPVATPPFFDIVPPVVDGIALPGGLFDGITAAYDDFGISLASYTRTDSDTDDPASIAFSAEGLAYLNDHLGTTVVLGGKLISLSAAGVAEELFGFTDPWLDVAPPSYTPMTAPPSLLLETTPIPLPAAFYLLAAALLPLLRARSNA